MAVQLPRPPSRSAALSQGAGTVSQERFRAVGAERNLALPCFAVQAADFPIERAVPHVANRMPLVHAAEKLLPVVIEATERHVAVGQHGERPPQAGTRLAEPFSARCSALPNCAAFRRRRRRPLSPGIASWLPCRSCCSRPRGPSASTARHPAVSPTRRRSAPRRRTSAACGCARIPRGSRRRGSP